MKKKESTHKKANRREMERHENEFNGEYEQNEPGMQKFYPQNLYSGGYA